MQRHFRAIPAFVAALIHIAIVAALLALGRGAPPPEAFQAALPIISIDRAPLPAPALARPGIGPAFLTPPVALAPLTIPALPPEVEAPGLSMLGGYVACGLNQALTAEERERCDKTRREFYTGAGPAEGPTAAALALEKRFAHDKAAQDAPVLLPCFTPAGPNIFCLLGALSGADVETGSYADVGRPENPLARPVFPYRPR